MLDVLIITRDEEANLPYCLEALQDWTARVFVVDSGSTDGTESVAAEFKAKWFHHDWQG